jgi:Bacterial Ig-like domain
MFHEIQEPRALSPTLSGRLAHRRRRSVRATIPAVCILVGALLTPAIASAGTAAVTFTDPGEHAFRVPQGLVGALHIDAIGAAGQDAASQGFQARGGIGALVSGNLAVTSGGLYAEVGVGGGGAVAGFAYPGGGASDVRRCPVAASFCPGASSSLQSRVLVAGGGGGANYFGDGGAAYTGFALGLAPQSAVAGEPGTSTLSGGGHGGGGGNGSTGGAGGAASAAAGAAGAGAPGTLGQGGDGGYNGASRTDAGSGGGGGYFGGGGGGQGDASPGGGLDGGGGGGGSSYVGNIGSATISPARVREPSVTFTYTENEPPALTLHTPAPSTTPTLAGTAGLDTGDEPAVTVTVRAGSGPGGPQDLSLHTTRDPSTGAYTVTPPSALAAGTYSAQATQADAAGNTATTQPVTFTIAGDPPASAADPAPGLGATSPGTDPTPTPATTGAPRAQRAVGALRISSVTPRRCRRGARCALVVNGRVARSTVGTIALTVRRGRGVRRVVVPIRAGRWTASIVPPGGASRRLTVTATFRGDAGHLPATARRSVVLRPSS